jgi:hypothetical protein
MSEAVTTLTVKGEGGDVFDMDVPAAGTVRREIFDDMVAKGRLEIVAGEIPAEDEGPNLAGMKKAELKALAEEKSIEVADGATVAELREALTAED